MKGTKNKVKVKVKSNTQNTHKKGNEKLHAFLHLLHSSEYYGEITLYFQNGNFEYLKETSRISKATLNKYFQNMETQKQKIKNNKAEKINVLQLLLPLFSVGNNNTEEK